MRFACVSPRKVSALQIAKGPHKVAFRASDLDWCVKLLASSSVLKTSPLVGGMATSDAHLVMEIAEASKAEHLASIEHMAGFKAYFEKDVLPIAKAHLSSSVAEPVEVFKKLYKDAEQKFSKVFDDKFVAPSAGKKQPSGTLT
jgi:hypothetical protein